MADPILPTSQAFPEQPLTASAAFPQEDMQPVSGPFADWMFNSTKGLRNLASAFGTGFSEAYGHEPSQIEQKSEEWLRKSGIFQDYSKNNSTFLRTFNEGVLRPLMLGTDIAARGVGGILAGVTEATGAASKELTDVSKDDYLPEHTKQIFGGISEIVKGIASGAGLEFATPNTVPAARAKGVVGEGEAGYFNTRKLTEDGLQARAEAAKEAGLPEVPPVEPPVTDVHTVARQIDPDTFQEFDNLTAYSDKLKETLRNFEENKALHPDVVAIEDRIQKQLDKVNGVYDRLTENQKAKVNGSYSELYDKIRELTDPETVQIQQELMQANYLRNSLIQKVQAAYKRAEELIPKVEEVKEASSTEAPTPTHTFTTAKGSTYELFEDGTTKRNKAARPEHPGEEGPQPQSEATYFVAPGSVDPLSLMQARNLPGRVALAVRKGSDGKEMIGVKYLDGKDAGKFERRTLVPFSREPQVGFTPVEVWKGGERVHFGNEITKVADNSVDTAPPVETLETNPELPQAATGLEEGTIREIEGTGPVRERGLSSSVKARAIANELEIEFGDLPEYNSISYKEQAEKAMEIVSNDYDAAVAMMEGRKKVPEGVLPGSIFTVLQKEATARGDLDTIFRLAHAEWIASRITTAAREVGVLGYGADSTNAVKLIKEVEQARREYKEKKQNFNEAKKSVIKEIKEAVKQGEVPHTPEAWVDFIKSIECK